MPIKTLYALLFVTLCVRAEPEDALAKAASEGVDNGVILMYHHVSDNTPGATSVSPQQFREHMQLLKDGGYQIVPLNEMVEHLRNGQALPNKAVAITFDDGYENIYLNAHPILQEYAFPYTVFISPAAIEQQANQLSWQQIKQMQAGGALFANHSNAHLHLLQRQPAESESQWLARIIADVQQAEGELQRQLGYSLKYIAYPYGEFDLTLKRALASLGYVGFGQHSGAIASYSDFAALPRFPAAGIYANPKTLTTKLNSLAMPVPKVSAHQPLLADGQIPPPIQLEISGQDIHASQIACYFQGRNIRQTEPERRLTMRIQQALPTGRSRVNCTAPSIQYKGRYYWLSLPWVVPDAAGNFID